jgi:hypothetical protein
MRGIGYPPGEWSPLLVGHQWPSESAVAQLGLWQENREQIADSHHYIADLLNAAKTGPLAVQEGITADSLVQVFHEGEQRARQTAVKNGVKKEAYGAALGSVNSLRDKLSDISEQVTVALGAAVAAWLRPIPAVPVSTSPRTGFSDQRVADASRKCALLTKKYIMRTTQIHHEAAATTPLPS